MVLTGGQCPTKPQQTPTQIKSKPVKKESIKPVLPAPKGSGKLAAPDRKQPLSGMSSKGESDKDQGGRKSCDTSQVCNPPVENNPVVGPDHPATNLLGEEKRIEQLMDTLEKTRRLTEEQKIYTRNYICTHPAMVVTIGDRKCSDEKIVIDLAKMASYEKELIDALRHSGKYEDYQEATERFINTYPGAINDFRIKDCSNGGKPSKEGLHKIVFEALRVWVAEADKDYRRLRYL